MRSQNHGLIWLGIGIMHGASLLFSVPNVIPYTVIGVLLSTLSILHYQSNNHLMCAGLVALTIGYILSILPVPVFVVSVIVAVASSIGLYIVFNAIYDSLPGVHTV